MRDWKLESLANGKEISAVLFRMEKEDYLWRWSTISDGFSGKLVFHLIFNRNFRMFLRNGKHPSLNKNQHLQSTIRPGWRT